MRLPAVAQRLLMAAAAVMVLAAADAPSTVESELATARQLAGADFADSLFICDASSTRIADMLANGPTWLPPTRAFDNLWYIGNAFVGVWVLRTSDGLIIFDAGQSEKEVRNYLEPGLLSIGLDPADIRYAIITHGHWDHYGGSKYLQERYGTRVGMSAEDWDMLSRQPPGSLARAPYFGDDQADRPPPRRDLVVSDGQKLALGDTQVTLLVTPGHTPGTLSALIPVREGGHGYVLSLLGGTAFPRKLEPDGAMGGLLQFEQSVERLRDLSRQAGAVGLLNTHIFVDGSDKRLAKARQRAAGEPNPFVLGADKVERYYGMFLACLRAARLRPQNPDAGPPMPSASTDGDS